MILNKLKLNQDTISALFVIGLVSFLILAGFVTGFVLPLFLVVMALSFAISFVYPKSGIYASIFLTLIFERFFTLAPIVIGYQEYKLYPLDIILGAVFLAYVFQIIPEIIKNNKKSLIENKYLIIFFILIGIHFLVDILFMDADKALAFSSFKYYIFYPWLYFITLFFFKNEQDVKRLIKFYLAGAIGILFFILFGLFNGGGLWTEYTPLSTGGTRILAFTHSFYILMGFLGAGVWSLYQKEKISSLLKIVMFFWVVGIVGSMMRHLWIGLISAILIIYILVDKYRKDIFKGILFKGIIGSIFIAMFLFFIAITSPHYATPNKVINKSWASVEERVGSLFSDFNQDESFSWRELVWKESLLGYVKNPIWGLGFGQKIYVESDDYRDFVEIRNIHNSWLVLLFQSGAIIFGIFLLFIFRTIWRLIKVKEKSWGDILLLGLIFNYLIVAVFQPYWETNMLAIFFWVILGLIGARSLSDLKHENSRNK